MFPALLCLIRWSPAGSGRYEIPLRVTLYVYVCYGSLALFSVFVKVGGGLFLAISSNHFLLFHVSLHFDRRYQAVAEKLLMHFRE